MDELSAVAKAEAEAMTWDKVRDHIHGAVDYTLRNWPTGPGLWKNATPEQIAERVTVFAMAAIHPVLTNEQVNNGVAMMRATLGRAGVDPSSLSWSESDV